MDVVKDETNGSANEVKSKFRYPIRPANKSKTKDDKSSIDKTASSTSKRGKPASNVSKIASILDAPGKEKSAKIPKRPIGPAKSSISPLSRSTTKVTPISETRTKRLNKGQGSHERPVSDVSKSSCRKKFSVLSSVSYWLSQIKLSESAAKHSISLGFFKLALESGCEPLQRMRDELKSYVRRNNLVELGEPLKELLVSYNIPGDTEPLQVSETCSNLPGEATQSSEEGLHSSSSVDGRKKLKPKSMNAENVQTYSVAKSAKRGSPQKISASKNRGSVNRNSTKSNTAVDNVISHPQKNMQKPTREVLKKEKAKTQNQEENFLGDKDLLETIPTGETQQDDKENKDTPQPGESCITEMVI